MGESSMVSLTAAVGSEFRRQRLSQAWASNQQKLRLEGDVILISCS